MRDDLLRSYLLCFSVFFLRVTSKKNSNLKQIFFCVCVCVYVYTYKYNYTYVYISLEIESFRKQDDEQLELCMGSSI